MIPSVSKLPYEQRLAKLQLWSLEDRRVRADIIEIYKIINGLSTVEFNCFFERSHYDRIRGHSLKLRKNRVLTDLRQHFFSERIDNFLDEDTISAPSVNSLKKKTTQVVWRWVISRTLKSTRPRGPSQSPGWPTLVFTGELYSNPVSQTSELWTQTSVSSNYGILRLPFGICRSWTRGRQWCRLHSFSLHIFVVNNKNKRLCHK